jgi:hypothetical protein
MDHASDKALARVDSEPQELQSPVPCRSKTESPKDASIGSSNSNSNPVEQANDSSTGVETISTNETKTNNADNQTEQDAGGKTPLESITEVPTGGPSDYKTEIEILERYLRNLPISKSM